jgi:hypothetical protein
MKRRQPKPPRKFSKEEIRVLNDAVEILSITHPDKNIPGRHPTAPDDWKPCCGRAGCWQRRRHGLAEGS